MKTSESHLERQSRLNDFKAIFGLMSNLDLVEEHKAYEAAGELGHTDAIYLNEEISKRLAPEQTSQDFIKNYTLPVKERALFEKVYSSMNPFDLADEHHAYNASGELNTSEGIILREEVFKRLAPGQTEKDFVKENKLAPTSRKAIEFYQHLRDEKINPVNASVATLKKAIRTVYDFPTHDKKEGQIKAISIKGYNKGKDLESKL